MSSVTIGFVNAKGGVGKTTLASQFAFYLANKKRKRVLVVDMDNQGNCSKKFLKDVPQEGTASHQLFYPDIQVQVQKTETGIDVIGVDKSPETANERFDIDKLSINECINVREHLKTVKDNYDFIVIDSPPGIHNRMIASIISCNYLVIPMDLSAESFEGISDISGLLSTLSHQIQVPSVLGVVINNVTKSGTDRAFYKQVYEAFNNADMNDILITKIIHSRSPIRLASFNSQPIWECLNSDVATRELTSVFQQLLKRIQ